MWQEPPRGRPKQMSLPRVSVPLWSALQASLAASFPSRHHKCLSIWAREDFMTGFGCARNECIVRFPSRLFQNSTIDHFSKRAARVVEFQNIFDPSLLARTPQFITCIPKRLWVFVFFVSFERERKQDALPPATQSGLSSAWVGLPALECRIHFLTIFACSC